MLIYGVSTNVDGRVCRCGFRVPGLRFRVYSLEYMASQKMGFATLLFNINRIEVGIEIESDYDSDPDSDLDNSNKELFFRCGF